MAALQMSLTDKALDKLPLATDGQYVVRDTELKGFLVVIGKRRKTFTVKGEGWQNGKRKNVYAAIGLVGDMTARDARLVAKEALTRIAKGLPAIEQADEDGAPEALPEVTGVTLWEAWERYLEAHLVRKKRSARTVASYADHVQRIFKAWRDRSLKDLGEDPSLVATRHDEVTKENGPYIANGAMRTLRAIYNHARKTHRYLPADNPVDAIDWNEETRRDTGMGPKALPAWFDELFALDNPLRREFHLFTLLSGCRPGALKMAEIAHVNFARRMLHIPAPKGGTKKAFDIPLSHAMVRCLIRAIRLGRQMYPEAAEQWIFAADSAKGHLVEQKEDREQDLSKWGNDLRQTFRTVGQAAGVSPLDTRMLMNHAFQDVNEGYITKNALLEDHLRGRQERISRAVLQAVETGRGQHRGRVMAWLCSSRIDALAKDGVIERPTLRLPPSNNDHGRPSAEAAPRHEPIRLSGAAESARPLKAFTMPIKVRSWAGEVAGSTKLEREYGISRSTLHGWQKQDRVVALLAGARKHVFPLAQFIDGRPVEGLAEIVAATGSPRTAWAWLVEPHPSLGAWAPLDQLKAGKVSAVTGLANQDFGPA